MAKTMTSHQFFFKCTPQGKSCSHLYNIIDTVTKFLYFPIQVRVIAQLI